MFEKRKMKKEMKRMELLREEFKKNEYVISEMIRNRGEYFIKVMTALNFTSVRVDEDFYFHLYIKDKSFNNVRDFFNKVQTYAESSDNMKILVELEKKINKLEIIMDDHLDETKKMITEMLMNQIDPINITDLNKLEKKRKKEFDNMMKLYHKYDVMSESYRATCRKEILDLLTED